MVHLAQNILIAAGILTDSCSIPLAASVDAGQGALQLVLALHLVLVGVVGVCVFDRAVDVLTDVEWTFAGIGTPPADERLVVGKIVAYLPVNLRDIVVHPSLSHPFQHVGIEVIVVLEAVGSAALGVVALVAIDAERRNTELHPGFHLANFLTHLLHEFVDVLPAPVTSVHAAAVCVVGGIVGNGNTGHGIGVEIVVHVNAVHIIAFQDVEHHLADEIAVFGASRIEEEQAVVIEETVGVARVFVTRGQRCCALRLGTERIDPGVQLHLARVALLNHPLQGVPVGVGRRSLLTCQIAAPGLYRALVKCIAFHANLKEDGIDAVFLQVVQLTGEHSLHPVASDVLELSVDGLNPGTAEFSLGILSHCRSCHKKQQK